MLDGVTLDQLRTFIAAVDSGSFSAAGRKLRRAQSVVSQTLANLEAQLGVKLFDRSARYPQLTEEGRSLLVDARSVAGNVDEFKARARAMRDGLEPELSVAMYVMYPMEALTRAALETRTRAAAAPRGRGVVAGGRRLGRVPAVSWPLGDLGREARFPKGGLGRGQRPLPRGEGAPGRGSVGQTPVGGRGAPPRHAD